MKARDVLTEKRLHNLEPMVAEITVDQLQAKLDDGEIFTLLEVTTTAHFASGHIAGAIHVPLEKLRETASRSLRKFQQIVVYCEEANSIVGINAARLLQQLAFANVNLLRGGKAAWRAAGRPLDDGSLEGKTEQSHNNHTAS